MVTGLPAAAEHGRAAPTLRLTCGGAVHRSRRRARRPQHAQGEPLLGFRQTYLLFEISKFPNFLMCEATRVLPCLISHPRLLLPLLLHGAQVGSENVFAERQPRHATWRSQTALTGYPAADCASPVQLRAQTACCRRALMACAIIARLACRGWPAPLTNSGTAVYPRTTQRPQSTGPHGLR